MRQPGDRLQKRFVVETVLGRGGMGTVYLTRDEVLGRHLAIKEMNLANASDTTAFLREARLLANLSHPNLVRIVDIFEEDGGVFLSMDYIQGSTLDDLITGHSGFLPLSLVLMWADTICDVLSYLHRHVPPVIYRDLKPANAMVDGNDKLWLVDFGIARVMDAGQTSTVVALTPGYAPIEQYTRGTSGPWMDVYAMGATLFTLVTRMLPPASVDLAMGTDELPSPRSINPDVTEELEAVIRQAMSPRKEDRFASIDVLRAALKKPTQVPVTTSVSSPTVVQVGPGELLAGRYRLERASGRTGRQVYRAHVEGEPDHRVFVREVPLTDEARAASHELRQRIVALADLNHPQIAPVLDIFSLAHAMYMVTEDQGGVPLPLLLSSIDGFLPLPMAMQVIEELCEVLDAMHSALMLCGELSPSRILVLEGGAIQVTDLALPPQLWGAPVNGYSPIEAYRTGIPCDTRSDLYALGAVIYTLLTRQIPPAAVDLVAGSATLVPPSRINPEVPEQVSETVMKLLHHSVTARCQSIGEVRQALGLSTGAAPESVLTSLGGGAPAGETFVPVSSVLFIPELQYPRPTVSGVLEVDPGASWFGKQQKSTTEPIEVEDLTLSSLTFTALRAHKPGTSIMVTFSMTRPEQGVYEVQARGLVQKTENLTGGAVRHVAEMKTWPSPLPREVKESVTALHERRQGRRFTRVVQVASSDLPGGRAVSVDISVAGVRLTCSGPMDVGTVTDLSLHLEDVEYHTSNVVVLEAQVVRCEPTPGPPGRYTVGMSFTAIRPSEGQVLLDFMRSMRWVARR
ncbi:MAG: protein kinase domain-containing protein [Candidatus Xenobia bacterium]